MKLYINGIEINHCCEAKIILPSTKQEECKLSKKYPTIKSWCDLIAFLINCNILASNSKSTLLTWEDVYNSHPSGELYFVLTAINIIKNVLKKESNAFTKLCFDVLDGKNNTPDVKYACSDATLIYKHIFLFEEIN